MLTWHGRLFVDGGQHSGTDVAWVRDRLGWHSGCRRWLGCGFGGVRVDCRWLWGFNRVRGVEGGWAVELAVFGLFFVGFGVSMASQGGLAVSTAFAR